MKKGWQVERTKEDTCSEKTQPKPRNIELLDKSTHTVLLSQIVRQQASSQAHQSHKLLYLPLSSRRSGSHRTRKICRLSRSSSHTSRTIWDWMSYLHDTICPMEAWAAAGVLGCDVGGQTFTCLLLHVTSIVAVGYHTNDLPIVWFFMLWLLWPGSSKSGQ